MALKEQISRNPTLDRHTHIKSGKQSADYGLFVKDRARTETRNS